MVILQVQIANFTVLDIECDPPVARHRDAPCPFTISDELMDTPTRRPDHTIHILRRNESREDVPHPIHEVAPHPTVIVMFDEPPQASVTDALNPHDGTMY